MFKNCLRLGTHKNMTFFETSSLSISYFRHRYKLHSIKTLHKSVRRIHLSSLRPVLAAPIQLLLHLRCKNTVLQFCVKEEQHNKYLLRVISSSLSLLKNKIYKNYCITRWTEIKCLLHHTYNLADCRIEWVVHLYRIGTTKIVATRQDMQLR